MTISLLQLNNNADNYWDKLIPFLTEHTFDVIQLQEVTGNETACGNYYSKRNVFAELQKLLGEKYNGVLSISQRFTSSPTSYQGNAIFYNNTFALTAKHELTLFHEVEFYPSDAEDFAKVGRKLLHLTLRKDDKEISFLNTHFAWGPTPIERPYQTAQGKKLISYLETVAKPFVFTGDLNLTPDQPTIQNIGKLAINLTEKNNVSNTLNPRLHKATQLFPKGLAVDYIFTSDDIIVKNFTVLEKDISDHLGLTAEIEV